MNTPKNTANTITQALQHKETAEKTPSKASIMNAILNKDSTKKLLENSLKENAGAFAASVIDLYNTDTYLQQCDPQEVFGECLKAVSLKLPINKQLGFAYIVPYKKNGKPTPQFQIGYKGLIQLAMRTGVYKHINADVVYEGEFKSYDKLTGALDISGEATSDKVVGYFAYIETINGFSKALYWTKEQVIKHASRYSKSYASGSDIWKNNFDEMAIKTVVRNLISKWGVMSVELVTAITEESKDFADQAIERGSDAAFEGTFKDKTAEQPAPEDIKARSGEEACTSMDT